jgi:alpha-L-rhamnosidase
MVAENWAALTRYAQNLIANARAFPGNVTACDPGESHWHGQNLALGDWCAPTNCSGKPAGSRCEVSGEMSGMSYILTLRAMATLAGALNKTAEKQHYSALAATATASASFHRVHYNEPLASYGGDEAMVQALAVPALVLKSAPSAEIANKVVSSVQHDLETRTNYHLSTGAVTSKWLLGVLSENGLHSAALKIATQTTSPSWGWWLALNATTCMETWHNGTGHHPGIGPFLGSVNSHNHVYLCGGIEDWMWTQLAGLKPTSPGLATITIAPRIDPSVGPSSLQANFSSPAGDIVVQWKREHCDADHLAAAGRSDWSAERAGVDALAL